MLIFWLMPTAYEHRPRIPTAGIGTTVLYTNAGRYSGYCRAMEKAKKNFAVNTCLYSIKKPAERSWFFFFGYKERD